MTVTPAAARPAQSPRRRRARVVAVLITGALILTGCGAGQRAQTAVEVPVIDGVTANVGPIDLRNVTIATPSNGSYGKDASAALTLFIVNNGAVDQLVSITSSAAASVDIYANEAAATAAASGEGASSTATPTDTASATDTATATDSDTSTPTDSISASSTPSASTSTPPVSVSLASGEITRIGDAANDPVIMIRGLRSALFPAMSIPLVFTFAQAGSATVWVSVHLSTAPANAPTLAVSQTDAG